MKKLKILIILFGFLGVFSFKNVSAKEDFTTKFNENGKEEIDTTSNLTKKNKDLNQQRNEELEEDWKENFFDYRSNRKRYITYRLNKIKKELLDNFEKAEPVDEYFDDEYVDLKSYYYIEPPERKEKKKYNRVGVGAIKIKGFEGNSSNIGKIDFVLNFKTKDPEPNEKFFVSRCEFKRFGLKRFIKEIGLIFGDIPMWHNDKKLRLQKQRYSNFLGQLKKQRLYDFLDDDNLGREKFRDIRRISKLIPVLVAYMEEKLDEYVGYVHEINDNYRLLRYFMELFSSCKPEILLSSDWEKIKISKKIEGYMENKICISFTINEQNSDNTKHAVSAIKNLIDSFKRRGANFRDSVAYKIIFAFFYVVAREHLNLIIDEVYEKFADEAYKKMEEELRQNPNAYSENQKRYITNRKNYFKNIRKHFERKEKELNKDMTRERHSMLDWIESEFRYERHRYLSKRELCFVVNLDSYDIDFDPDLYDIDFDPDLYDIDFDFKIDKHIKHGEDEDDFKNKEYKKSEYFGNSKKNKDYVNEYFKNFKYKNFYRKGRITQGFRNDNFKNKVNIKNVTCDFSDKEKKRYTESNKRHIFTNAKFCHVKYDGTPEDFKKFYIVAYEVLSRNLVEGGVIGADIEPIDESIEISAPKKGEYRYFDKLFDPENIEDIRLLKDGSKLIFKFTEKAFNEHIFKILDFNNFVNTPNYVIGLGETSSYAERIAEIVFLYESICENFRDKKLKVLVDKYNENIVYRDEEIEDEKVEVEEEKKEKNENEAICKSMIERWSKYYDELNSKKDKKEEEKEKEEVKEKCIEKEKESEYEKDFIEYIDGESIQLFYDSNEIDTSSSKKRQKR